MPIDDAERFRRADALFDAALDKPASERDAFIDEACAGDDGFRHELRRLLDAHRRSVDFLGAPAVEMARPLIADVEGVAFRADMAPQRVGAFRIERELGHGGMGVVYLATRDDGQFQQRVALKVIRHTGPTIVQRFLEERRILAMLEHPRIARLVDGGVTADGLPYFAMEYIEGEPIDQYCATRGLSIDQRLALFVSLCEAVQYAHQQLVVHRDLKPSNVLVARDGQLKLLDFGIAKLLDPIDSSSDVTLTGAGHPMTPDYAAPEQIRGERASTATDAYGLGVLLYLLLSGKRPYDLRGHSAAEIERIVCELDPPPPSVVFAGSASDRRRLTGDLDRIVMKALRKERGERYATAHDVALDIGRHLSGHPVAARRMTTGYRVGRFVKRNRWAVTAVALIVALVAAYGVTVTLDRRRISAALDEAVIGSRRTEQVTDFMLGLFESSENGKAFGDTVQARELLSRGLSRVRELSGQPEVQAQMLEVVGRLYSQLGEYSRAEPLLREALDARRKLRSTSPTDSATTLESLANVDLAQQNFADAVELRQRVLAVYRVRYGAMHPSTANALFNLASVMHQQGRYKEAAPIMDEWSRIVAALPPDTSAIRASQLEYQATLLEFRGIYDRSEPLWREALAINRALYGSQHPRVATSLTDLAYSLDRQKRLDEAERLMREAVAMLRAVYPSGHPRLAQALRLHGLVLEHMQRFEDAKPLLREAISTATAFDGEHGVIVVDSELDLALALAMTKAFAESESYCRKALASLLMKYAATSPLTQRADLCLGDALLGQGQYAEAERLLLGARESVLSGKGIGGLKLASVNSVLVRLYEAQGRQSEAAKYRVAPAP